MKWIKMHYIITLIILSFLLVNVNAETNAIDMITSVNSNAVVNESQNFDNDDNSQNVNMNNSDENFSNNADYSAIEEKCDELLDKEIIEREIENMIHQEISRDEIKRILYDRYANLPCFDEIMEKYEYLSEKYFEKEKIEEENNEERESEICEEIPDKIKNFVEELRSQNIAPQDMIQKIKREFSNYLNIPCVNRAFQEILQQIFFKIRTNTSIKPPLVAPINVGNLEKCLPILKFAKELKDDMLNNFTGNITREELFERIYGILKERFYDELPNCFTKERLMQLLFNEYQDRCLFEVKKIAQEFSITNMLSKSSQKDIDKIIVQLRDKIKERYNNFYMNCWPFFREYLYREFSKVQLMVQNKIQESQEENSEKCDSEEIREMLLNYIEYTDRLREIIKTKERYFEDEEYKELSQKLMELRDRIVKLRWNIFACFYDYEGYFDATGLGEAFRKYVHPLLYEEEYDFVISKQDKEKSDEGKDERKIDLRAILGKTISEIKKMNPEKKKEVIEQNIPVFKESIKNLIFSRLKILRRIQNISNDLDISLDINILEDALTQLDYAQTYEDVKEIAKTIKPIIKKPVVEYAFYRKQIEEKINKSKEIILKIITKLRAIVKDEGILSDLDELEQKVNQLDVSLDSLRSLLKIKVKLSVMISDLYRKTKEVR